MIAERRFAAYMFYERSRPSLILFQSRSEAIKLNIKNIVTLIKQRALEDG